MKGYADGKSRSSNSRTRASSSWPVETPCQARLHNHHGLTRRPSPARVAVALWLPPSRRDASGPALNAAAQAVGAYLSTQT
jgi:hypothetical protein